MRWRGVGFGATIATAGLLLAASLAPAQGRRAAVVFATAPGTSAMVALAMETLVNDLLPDFAASTTVADSEGDVLAHVRQGRAHFGLVTIPELARRFPSVDDRDRSGLSFVMGGHAATVAHVFVRDDLPSPTLKGLRGRRVAVPEPGSPGEALARALLEAHGLTDRDIKPVFSRVEEQVRAFETGFVDAVILVVPVPSPVVASPAPTKLAATGKARLLSLEPDALERLIQRDPASSRHRIEAGTYPGQAEAALTVARKNAIVARKDLDPVMVYRFVKTILEHPAKFAQVCPLAMAYTPRNILPETPLLPLHPGAERYFREVGIL